ncbi:MAG: hypothetical protein OXM61_11025 [Candidatus Poribacteria bacterium]|nr:hypothetical protein [Candidatus Poribacteria bacterium]
MSTIDLIIEEQDYFKANSCTFYLLTREWQSYNLPDSFNWEIRPFQDDQKTHIPRNSGIYSFVIQPGIASYPSCSYPMYIGLAGLRTLRKRFSDYLYEQNNPSSRPNILRLLNKYKGYLHFCYSVVNERERLKEIEDALIKAFLPPCNDQYPGEFNRAVGAF